MLMFQLIFSVLAQTRYEDSFLMVNASLPNWPLTFIPHPHTNHALPLRLMYIDDTHLETQLFVLRFNIKNRAWVSPAIAQEEFGSVDNGLYLSANHYPFEPNLKFHKINHKYNGRAYFIVSDRGLCLTVADKVNRNDMTYYPLTFAQCEELDTQVFTFVPKIVGERFVGLTNAEDVLNVDLKAAIEQLDMRLNQAKARLNEGSMYGTLDIKKRNPRSCFEGVMSCN